MAIKIANELLQNKKKLLNDSLIEGKNRDENLIAKLSKKRY